MSSISSVRGSRDRQVAGHLRFRRVAANGNRSQRICLKANDSDSDKANARKPRMPSLAMICSTLTAHHSCLALFLRRIDVTGEPPMHGGTQHAFPLHDRKMAREP